ncbi:MAG: RDD family protein [Solirubrobacteraceae bacterium]
MPRATGDPAARRLNARVDRVRAMGDLLGRRVVAAVIDVAIIVVLLGVVAGLLGNDDAADASLAAKLSGGPGMLFFALTLLYFVATELAWAQTVGKRVMKLRVVRLDGTKASAGPVVIRNVVRLFDWLPFLYILGAIAVFATGERRARLGDIAAKTKVVAGGSPPDQPAPRERPDDDDVLAQILR